VEDAGAVRPRRTPRQDDQAEQQQHRDHAGEQKRQRLGVGQAELGADEAGGPQHDKRGGRCGNGKLGP